jgi:hypothetical protein
LEVGWVWVVVLVVWQLEVHLVLELWAQVVV